MELLPIIQTLRTAVEPYFEGDCTGHDIYHGDRVYRVGMKIAEEESADKLIVGTAAYIHDLLRPKEKEVGRFNYHFSPEALAEIQEVLRTVEFPADKLAPVLQVVELHEDYSFGVNSGKPNTIEGLVLQDADRLDAMGAIGIARCLRFGGYHGNPLWIPEQKTTDENDMYDPSKANTSSIQHFYDKLLKLRDEMNTATGRKIAEERHQFMEIFLQQFFAEWK